VYMLEKLGISTGVDLNELVKTGAWISQRIGIPNGSRAGSAISAKLVDPKPFPQPVLSPRRWKVLESTKEYRSRRSGVNVEICLTRGRNGNALTTTLIEALIRLFRAYSLDHSVFRIILTGEGKYFCTGMDLKSTSTTEERFRNLKDLFRTIDECPKTTIAVVNGPCFGGGVGLAFVCDIRLATSQSTFTLSEVRLGLCPATISEYVIREWGISYTRVAMLTGRQITASELAHLKILQGVAEDQNSLQVALEALLQDLKFNAPGASKLSKDLIRVAYVDSGGEEQARVIKSSFDKMMITGSEHDYARSEFKKGIKAVDWEAMFQQSLSKL